MKDIKFRPINSKAILIGIYARDIKCKIIDYMKDGKGEIVYVVEKIPSKLQSLAYEHHLRDI